MSNSIASKRAIPTFRELSRQTQDHEHYFIEKMLKKCSEQVFDFSELDLNDGCVEILAVVISGCFDFHKLNLSCNSFTIDGHLKLLRGLPLNQNLTSVSSQVGPFVHKSRRKRF